MKHSNKCLALQSIAVLGRLTKNEYQLMMYLMGIATGTKITTDQTHLATTLNMDKSNLSKALRGLERRHIVMKTTIARYHHKPTDIALEINYDHATYDLMGESKQRKKQKARSAKTKRVAVTQSRKKTNTAPMEQPLLPFFSEDK